MELTNEQLTKLKQVELEMLQEFIRVCKILNLKYYVIGGTLLGAVRHGGFIPWDDDIDVGMIREDYEIFVAKAQEYLPKKYFLQTGRTDPEWCMHFAKIRDTQTLFVEKTVENKKMNHGIFIDIFPLDHIKRKKRGWKIRALSYVEAKWYRRYPFKDKIKRFALGCTVFSFSIKNAFNRKERIFLRRKTGKYLINYSSAWGDKEIFDKNYFRDIVELQFENLIVNAPIDYDKVLTDLYGDWRKLPPEDQRVAHHYISKIDFDYKNK